MSKAFCRSLVLFAAFSLFSFETLASAISLLENTSFVRTKGKPKVETVQFSYQAGQQFQLTVFNGGENKQYCRISSAVIELNGITIFSQSDFNQQVFKLTADIQPQESNTISVKLNSKPGCGIELNVSGEESSPALAITSSPTTQIISGELYQYTLSTNILLNWDNASVELISAPEGMTVTNETINWTPNESDVSLHNIILQVVDAEHGIAEQSFELNVISANKAPIANDIVVNGVEDHNIDIQLTATDPNNDPMTFELLSAPEHGIVQQNGAQVIFTPVDNFFGNDSFQFIANDGEFNSELATVTIEVTGENDAPVLISKPLLSVLENNQYVYLVEAIDVDGDVNNFSLLQSPLGMSIDATIGEVSWLPSQEQLGEHSITIEVADPSGATVEQSYLLQVVNVNDAPSITSTPVTTSNEDETYIYNVVATDPDVADSLTFSLDIAPVGMVIDSVSGQISWTPNNNQVGNHSITLSVGDAGGLTVSQEFVLLVENVNDAPTIVTSPDENAIAEVLYQSQIIAEDQDEDIITYSLISGPEGLEVNTQTGLITWLPAIANIGIHFVSIDIHDGNNGHIELGYDITVEDNQHLLPVISSSPVLIANLGASYEYDVNTEEPSGGPIVYSLFSAPIGMDIVSETGLISWLAPEEGQFDVSILVTNDLGLSAKQNYTIDVKYVEPKHEGSDFWLAFSYNNTGADQLLLYISGKESTSGIVSVPLQGIEIPFDVTAGEITQIELDRSLWTTIIDGAQNKGIHVSSEKNIVLYALNHKDQSTDGFLVMPTDTLGMNYRAMTYDKGQITVVAPEDDTTVIFEFSDEVTAYTSSNIHYEKGEVLSIALDKGQSFSIQTSWGTYTGTKVSADKPVGVFTGNHCTLVPITNGWCDHVVEHIPDISYWGKEYAFVPLALRKKGDTIRAVAAFDNTIIRINDEIVTTLQAGEWIEKILDTPSVISANSPVLVAQFSNGGTYDRAELGVGGPIGDPFMMLLTAERSFISDYTFTTTNRNIAYNFVNVVIEQSDASTLTLDGITVNTDTFLPIPNTTKLAGSINLAKGAHTLLANNPFGAYIYGFGVWDSYGYQGGLKLPRFSTSDVLNVSLSDDSPNVAEQVCISATLLNNNTPRIDTRTDIEITGVNTITGHSYTDNSGQASFCYVGKTLGTDVIHISTGLSSADITIEWNSVIGNGNTTPVITSRAVVDAFIDTLYKYQVEVYDADPDTILSFNLITAPLGMTINANGLIQWSPTETEVGSYSVSVNVVDESGNEDGQSYQLNTYQGNRAPYIVQAPSIEVAYIHHYYSDTITLADPDGDLVYCQIFDSTIFPDDHSNNQNCNLVKSLQEEDLGEHQINLRIHDRNGGQITHSYTLLVKENHRPEVISAPAQYARVGEAYQSQLVVTDPDDDALVMAISNIKHLETGSSISTSSVDFNSTTGEINWTPSSMHGGTYQFLVRLVDAVDVTGYNFTIFVSPADQPFEPIIRATPLYAQINESVTLQASSQGAVGDVSYQLSVDGVSVELDENNQFVYNDTATTGTHTLTLTATNSGGETATIESFFSINDGADITPPVATLNTPADASRITTLTDIFVTATDDNISQWKLVLISASDTVSQQVLAQGTDNLSNEKAGIFDPTMLVNGQYHVQLEVTDTSGQTSYDGVTVSVEGNLKVGNFTYTVDEFTYPMAGLPITVSRTYDSRRKHEKLDFGYGWFLSYTGIKLEKSRGLGKAWQLNEYPTGPLGVLNNYCVESVGKIIATVSLPNDEVERFQVKASPECNLGTPILDVNLEFIPLDNTESTLSSQAEPLVRLLNRSLEILGSSEVYDANDFILTTRAGFKYHFNTEQGITFAEEPNGSSLTFNNTGIHHSAGKSVTLSRASSSNFIQSITSPDNHIYYYSYDNYDNLVEGRTPRGGKENYSYNYRHGLLDIIDNEGRTKVKNIYGDDNRLIAQDDNEGNRIAFNHDIAGKQSTITDKRGNISFYYYDDEGNVTSMVDALGHTTAYTYDANNNVLTTANPLGHVTTNVYSDKNDLLTQTDAKGNKLAYTYNSRGQELTLQDARGEIYTNTYDSVGNLLTITDPMANVVGNNINAQGLPILIQDAQGNTTTFEYDELGNKTKETDALGNSRIYTYTAANLVKTKTVSRSLADGSKALETVSYTYDAMGNLTQYNDGVITKYYAYDLQGNKISENDGGSITYEYDVYGRVVKESFISDNNSIQRSYDVDGNLISEKDRNGNTTQFEYDALSRLVKTINPDDTFTLVNYDTIGRITSEIDELNNTTNYEYDNIGQRIKVTDALGNITRFSYDANGNVLTETDALGHITTYQYDALDRRASTTLSNSSSITAVHDALGREIQKTDQAGISANYEYDVLGRLIKVIDAMGEQTSYGYDEVGNKISQTDAMGRVTRWEYDRRGLVTARILPEGQRESFTYNSVGDILTHTDFNGKVAQYNYHNYRSLKNISYLDGSDIYGYDSNGNRTSASAHGAGSWSYEYDSRDRLTKETQPSGDVLDYTYDAAGNKIKLSVTYANGDVRVEISTYDALNRLSTVTDNDGNITTYAYDAVGNQSSITHSNTNITSYTYDDLNRLTQLQHKQADNTVIQQFDYTLDVTGRRTKLSELSGRESDYSYDSLYRLTTETITDAVNGNYSATYAFDKVGNRTQSIINGVTTASTYDENDRLLQAGETVYVYDDAGNTLSKTSDADSTTYTYDNRQKLTAASITEASVTTNASYQYNINGIRTGKVENGTSINYLIDSNRDYAQVIAEQNDSNQINVEYVFGDDLLSQKRGAEALNYHYDGLGSTRLLTDSDGTVTDSYVYDAFGETLAATGTTENDYLFTGEQFDHTLGKYYLRARYYDQGVGRFSQKDTFPGWESDPITLHKYLYGNAEPVNHIDPSGHFSLGELGATIRVIGIQATQSIARVGNSATRAILKLGRTAGRFGKTSIIRVQYMNRVSKLRNIAAKMRSNGKSAEEIAKALNRKRRALGRLFKNVTDAEARQAAFARNMREYGDKWGPTWQYLRSQGKSWEEIAESAAKPNSSIVELIKIFFTK